MHVPERRWAFFPPVNAPDKTHERYAGNVVGVLRAEAVALEALCNPFREDHETGEEFRQRLRRTTKIANVDAANSSLRCQWAEELENREGGV